MKHFLVIIGLITVGILRGQSLMITAADIKQMKAHLGKYPMFDQAYAALKKQADNALAEKMDVPLPKDPAGAYTHERHKNNYLALHAAGVLYAMTQDKRYADYVRKMLLQYAALIPTLGNHPQARSSSPGRLFHQALNDCNWIVQAIQGYDCVKKALSAADRKTIEENVFRKLCQFLTRDLENWFNLIHNHGVWAVAAVGMTGYALNDPKLVEMALKGTKNDGKGGFLAQLDQLFSPDGYYAEGPYYTRYALMPFYFFALTIENNAPQRRIFQYRDQILKKAFFGALQLTYTNGAFFPINDAMKDKDWTTPEMAYILNIAFEQYGQDETLLSVAKKQGKVTFGRQGLAVAKAIKEKPKAKPFQWRTLSFTDGTTGTEGGLTVMRHGDERDQTCVVFKYGVHGMSHGHYDKLHYVFYDQNQEILPDYGAARFLNIKQKYGGRYLPENQSYAMQTVAHNALVVDETSQYGGKEAESEKHHANLYFQDFSQANCQIVSAEDTTAYPGVAMRRTLALIQPDGAKKAFLLDVYRVLSEQKRQYDLSFHHLGQLISTNFTYQAFTETRQTVGKKAGYQHLWLEAKGKARATEGVASVTFLAGNRYYTVSTTADSTVEILLTRIGANDPNFNLRNEQGFIFRQNAARKTIVSVVEPHGNFDGRSENSSVSESQVSELTVLFDDEKATIVAITIDGQRGILCLANDTAAKTAAHSVAVGTQQYAWTGPYAWKKP